MRVLFLGAADSPICAYLKTASDEIYGTEEKIDTTFTCFDWIVSHSYRHIIKPNLLELFPGHAINCHISYLPWNRGADPNLWSWVDDTPKGATIHLIDEGVDTGDILSQRELRLRKSETLTTSYQKLQDHLLQMFKDFWPKREKAYPRKQIGRGSYHTKKDREKLEHLLIKGWDTPVAELVL